MGIFRFMWDRSICLTMRRTAPGPVRLNWLAFPSAAGFVYNILLRPLRHRYTHLEETRVARSDMLFRGRIPGFSTQCSMFFPPRLKKQSLQCPGQVKHYAYREQERMRRMRSLRRRLPSGCHPDRGRRRDPAGQMRGLRCLRGRVSRLRHYRVIGRGGGRTTA